MGQLLYYLYYSEGMIDERDENDRTPLHHAMNKSQFSRAEFLLLHGSGKFY